MRRCPRRPGAAQAISVKFPQLILVEEETGLRVPVCRLRYESGRDKAMRGDGFIDAEYDGVGEKLRLLKGEAKRARRALSRDSGHCTPDSLLFVAARPLKSSDPGDNALVRCLRDEAGLRSLRADRIDHMPFTVSGNGPHASLKQDLGAAGTNRDHCAVNIRVKDHPDFIVAMHEEAEEFEDD